MDYLEDPIISKKKAKKTKIYVVRYLGNDVPTILCDKVQGVANSRSFGLCKVCEACDFRFLCATNSLEEIADIADPQYDIEITELGGTQKRFIKRDRSSQY